MRAVEAAAARDLTAYNSPGREAIPNIVLRVLDGLKIEAGQVWDDESKSWKPRAKICAENHRPD